MNGKIFVLIYEKKTKYNLNLFTEYNNYIYLQVGSNKNTGYLRDNIGKNISDENYLYSEYSGIYWVKNNYLNLERLKYIGFEHPDRYLLTENNKILDSDWIENKLLKYDFILPIKYIFINKNANHVFLIDHTEDELDILIKTFKQIYGEKSKINSIVQNRLFGQEGHYNNIFICSYSEFIKYYDFCFNILNTIKKQNKNFSYRLFGYLGEFLIDIYIQYYNKTYIETNYNIPDRGIYTPQKPIIL